MKADVTQLKCEDDMVERNKKDAKNEIENEQ
jgi:hypothetical protein